MNDNAVTLNKDVWTVKNAFYGKQLFGYVYDNLDVGGHSWHGIAADIKAKQVDDHYGLKLPFVSFSAPKLGVISKKTTLDMSRIKSKTLLRVSGCFLPNSWSFQMSLIFKELQLKHDLILPAGV